MPKVAIIGSGIAGLSLGIRLKMLGYEVDIYEKNESPGGKLNEKKIGNYRFDRGPSLFTMPENIEDLFSISKTPIENYFSYEALETICHYFWEDGTRINSYKNKDKFVNELVQKLGENKTVLKKFLEDNKTNYDVTSPVFLEQSLHLKKNYLNWKTFKAVLRIPKLNLFQSMNQVNSKTFKNKKTIQFFNRFATYNGSNPYRAPGLLNVISALEIEKGAFYPKGGMYSITKSVFELGKKNGINFFFNADVKEILLEKNRVKGIKVDSRELPYPLVVSNADIHPTYKNLLHGNLTKTSLLNREKSSSAIIFYWGVKKSFPDLSLHNIFFSENYQDEFEHIFMKRKIYHDPTLYINITSKITKSDAPENCENWFVMINTHNDQGENWEEEILLARKNILEKVKRILKVDLESFIEEEDVLHPKKIELETASFRGSLYGNSSNSRNEAFFRQSNFHQKIKGLYFCGGSVHPGGGIPLCMLSAKITAELIKERE